MLKLRVHFDGKHPIHTLHDSGDEFEEDELNENFQMDPNLVISKRTRSKKSIVTPISVSKIGKKYIRFGVYNMLCANTCKHMHLIAKGNNSSSLNDMVVVFRIIYYPLDIETFLLWYELLKLQS